MGPDLIMPCVQCYTRTVHNSHGSSGRPPGPIVLFGSGEASPSARRAHAVALERLAPPIRASVLETPAGFEPNSARVAARLADYLRHRFQVETCVVPARRRGTPESPDELAILNPLLTANYIMLGPGSPTYTVRQLTDSLAWQILLARHRMGAALVLASAAAIATSLYALPVYEIYKVGQDLHWQAGLDLLGPFGGRIVVVPHWNNHEGGAELDTSHSYMGQQRFDALHSMLPPDVDVLGVDEHTAVHLDFEYGKVQVLGRGGMTWLSGGRTLRCDAGSSVPLETVGLTRVPSPSEGLSSDLVDIIEQAVAAADSVEVSRPTPALEALVAERNDARERGNWSRADELRAEIAAAGWNVRDTPDGPELIPS
jgi:hypothetical protein